jgi:amidase
VVFDILLGPLWSWSAVEMAAAIRSGDVSSRELVAACLRRIELVNPAINAVVRFADGPLEAAEQADADLRRGAVLGPLHGVPFTIKDSLDTAGVITSAGTVGWADRVPDRDATVVARLGAAGGILLGKTNTPEFTWANEADNLVYGRTSNPYDLDRSPGGSSGGSAAIVAAGGSPFDIGSDTGDSIRQPSHVCGVAGLKPTSGRVPRTGHHPSYRGILESLTQLGPIARRVDDLSLILPIIAGPDGEDPHVAPVALGDPADVTISGLRAAWFADNGVHTPSAETMTTVRRAAEALRDAGAQVDERVPPDQARAADLWERLVDADGHAWLRRLIAAAGTEGAGSYAGRADWVSASFPLPGDELTALVEAVDDVRASMLRWIHDVDVIVSPVLPRPALPHGAGYTSAFADTYSEVHNLTGWPAAVVRGGTSPEGLPIGVQLIAPPWREDIVLAAAKVVEDALGGWQPPPGLPGS